jgi:bisphosphoglycerate-dependent phosphoglycerate mutase
MLVMSGICGWNTMCENMKDSWKGKKSAKRKKKFKIGGVKVWRRKFDVKIWINVEFESDWKWI